MDDRSTELTEASQNSPFDAIRSVSPHRAEYWSARDLQQALGYSKWSNFKQAIKKAVTSCRQSGNDPTNHFADAGKMVGIGSGSNRSLGDFHLSRFACYLIAQNGDPQKPEIATAQKYFAIQTRRQEISDQLARPRTLGASRQHLRRVQDAFGRRPPSRGPEQHVRRVPRCRIQRALRSRARCD